MLKKQMSAEEFKQIRTELGLSQHRMANLIGYENRASVCLFESGQRPISPQLTLLVEMLAEKKRMRRTQ